MLRYSEPLVFLALRKLSKTPVFSYWKSSWSFILLPVPSQHPIFLLPLLPWWNQMRYFEVFSPPFTCRKSPNKQPRVSLIRDIVRPQWSPQVHNDTQWGRHPQAVTSWKKSPHEWKHFKKGRAENCYVLKRVKFRAAEREKECSVHLVYFMGLIFCLH